jgi:hypothetical protein
MRTLPRIVPSRFIVGLLSLAALSLSLPASASSVTYEIETESESGETAMSFEFRNDMARMNFSEDNYFIVSEDVQYMVSRTEEGWQVLEIGSMTKALVSFASQYAEQMTGATQAGELEPTGRTERVAGIKGEVYRYYDEEEKTEVEVVLTKNRDVVEANRAMMETFASLFGEDDLRAQSDQAFWGKGLLLSRSEDSEFRLASVSGKAVPKSRFELPAEPTKLGFDFSNLFGQANSGTATEAATEAQEQEGKTAKEIGEDANELDKALKSVTGLGESAAKAWGKLFGGD